MEMNSLQKYFKRIAAPHCVGAERGGGISTEDSQSLDPYYPEYSLAGLDKSRKFFANCIETSLIHIYIGFEKA